MEAFLLTVAIAFAGGVLNQRTVLRPMERAPVLSNVIVFIGLLVIFNALSGWLFDHTIKVFPTPFPKEGLWVSSYFSGHEWGSSAVTLGVLIVVYLMFRYTPTGLAMRAAAQNPESARLVGIRVSWMLALGLGLVVGLLVLPFVLRDLRVFQLNLMIAYAIAILGLNILTG